MFHVSAVRGGRLLASQLFHRLYSRTLRLEHRTFTIPVAGHGVQRASDTFLTALRVHVHMLSRSQVSDVTADVLALGTSRWLWLEDVGPHALVRLVGFLADHVSLSVSSLATTQSRRIHKR